MSFRQELRESPATYALGASWLLVYALLNFAQGGFSLSEISLLGFGAVKTDTSHLFGDLTWRDFSHGEIWRAVTATFIHFSLAHLLLNLIGLIQLGRMIEEWYGPKQFFAICIAVGGIGNVIGVTMRQGVAVGIAWLQAHNLARLLPPFLKNSAVPSVAENIPAAGGSTIILGLIGLGLVVGWRSRTRVGMYLRDQMFGFLAFTAVIGIVSWNVIDNYGHAGGAIAGCLIGFAHRFLVKRADKGFFRYLFFVGSLTLVGSSAAFQAFDAAHDILQVRIKAAAKERLLMIGRTRQLRESLVVLSGQYERVAFERLVPILNELLQSDPPWLDMPIDLTPLIEISNTSNTALQLGGTARDAVVNLERLLQSIRGLRGSVEPSIDGPEFDDIDRIGNELCVHLPSSADTHAFRIARVALFKRVNNVLDRLMKEVESLELTQQTRR